MFNEKKSNFSPLIVKFLDFLIIVSPSCGTFKWFIYSSGYFTCFQFFTHLSLQVIINRKSVNAVNALVSDVHLTVIVLCRKRQSASHRRWKLQTSCTVRGLLIWHIKTGPKVITAFTLKRKSDCLNGYKKQSAVT